MPLYAVTLREFGRKPERLAAQSNGVVPAPPATRMMLGDGLRRATIPKRAWLVFANFWWTKILELLLVRPKPNLCRIYVKSMLHLRRTHVEIMSNVCGARPATPAALRPPNWFVCE